VVSFSWHNRLLSRKAIFLLFAGTGCICALAGCRNLPRSGFDPYGERLFESRPIADCPLFKRRTDSAPATISSTPIAAMPQPEGINPEGASIFTPPPSVLPGDLGASRTNPAVPLYGSTATPLAPGARAVTTALIAHPDAGPTPVFADTGGYALPTVPVTGPALIMTPREQIAPIGSEVVLIASCLGNKDRLITNEKIEWALEGVGTIEKFDAGSHCDYLCFDYVKAKKVSERYAITKTSSVYQTIDRGTPDTTDDIHLLRGQTWVSINSLKEGTTHVTAFAPNMTDWSKRTDAGIVHWVDAQWVLPRLAIAPVGESRMLTTTVLRATNGQPRKGWIVRYAILNGPAAGLGVSGAQIEEIETDWSGQATTILTPREQKSGVNTISIQIIRPAGVDGTDRRITVGSEMVRQTWAGNPNILLNISGQREARLGEELPYEITAENRSSTPVQGVIALQIPPMASYIVSNPTGQSQGSTVLWNVNLQPNAVTRINVVLRQGTPGSLWLRPEFHPTNPAVTTMPTVPTSPTVPTPAPSTFAPSPSQSGQQESGATRFPGTQQNPPSVPPPPPPPANNPPPPPAAVFPSTSPELSVQIVPNPLTPIVQGNYFQFYVSITNTDTTDAKNVVAFIPLPANIQALTVGGDSWSLTVAGGEPSSQTKPSDWEVGVEERNHRVRMTVPTLPAGTTAHFALQYPTIDQQGYAITCTVFVGGLQVTQGTQHIVP